MVTLVDEGRPACESCGRPLTPREIREWEEEARAMHAEALAPAALPTRKSERPDPEWVRGTCPRCGEEMVSNTYYTGGIGYRIYVECWAALGEERERTCDYRRLL